MNRRLRLLYGGVSGMPREYAQCLPCAFAVQDPFYE